MYKYANGDPSMTKIKNSLINKIILEEYNKLLKEAVGALGKNTLKSLLDDFIKIPALGNQVIRKNVKKSIENAFTKAFNKTNGTTFGKAGKLDFNAWINNPGMNNRQAVQEIARVMWMNRNANMSEAVLEDFAKRQMRRYNRNAPESGQEVAAQWAKNMHAEAKAIAKSQPKVTKRDVSNKPVRGGFPGDRTITVKKQTGAKIQPRATIPGAPSPQAGSFTKAEIARFKNYDADLATAINKKPGAGFGPKDVAPAEDLARYKFWTQSGKPKTPTALKPDPSIKPMATRPLSTQGGAPKLNLLDAEAAAPKLNNLKMALGGAAVTVAGIATLIFSLSGEDEKATIVQQELGDGKSLSPEETEQYESLLNSSDPNAIRVFMDQEAGENLNSAQRETLDELILDLEEAQLKGSESEESESEESERPEKAIDDAGGPKAAAKKTRTAVEGTPSKEKVIFALEASKATGSTNYQKAVADVQKALVNAGYSVSTMGQTFPWGLNKPVANESFLKGNSNLIFENLTKTWGLIKEDKEATSAPGNNWSNENIKKYQIDGKVGPKTLKAAENFQKAILKANKTEENPTPIGKTGRNKDGVDRIVGRQSWKYLSKYKVGKWTKSLSKAEKTTGKTEPKKNNKKVVPKPGERPVPIKPLQLDEMGYSDMALAIREITPKAKGKDPRAAREELFKYWAETSAPDRISESGPIKGTLYFCGLLLKLTIAQPVPADLYVRYQPVDPTAKTKSGAKNLLKLFEKTFGNLKMDGQNLGNFLAMGPNKRSKPASIKIKDEFLKIANFTKYKNTPEVADIIRHFKNPEVSFADVFTLICDTTSNIVKGAKVASKKNDKKK